MKGARTEDVRLLALCDDAGRGHLGDGLLARRALADCVAHVTAARADGAGEAQELVEESVGDSATKVSLTAYRT